MKSSFCFSYRSIRIVCITHENEPSIRNYAIQTHNIIIIIIQNGHLFEFTLVGKNYYIHFTCVI